MGSNGGALVYTVINIRVPYKAGNFLTSLVTSILSRRLSFMELVKMSLKYKVPFHLIKLGTEKCTRVWDDAF